MSAGNNAINLVAPAGGTAGCQLAGPLAGTLGAFLWRGFQSGADLRPTKPPTNQFFM